MKLENIFIITGLACLIGAVTTGVVARNMLNDGTETIVGNIHVVKSWGWFITLAVWFWVEKTLVAGFIGFAITAAVLEGGFIEELRKMQKTQKFRKTESKEEEEDKK